MRVDGGRWRRRLAALAMLAMVAPGGGCSWFTGSVDGPAVEVPEEPPRPPAPLDRAPSQPRSAELPDGIPDAPVDLEPVRFELDSSALTPQARATLQRHARELEGPRAGERVRIEGHCDERGTTEYNLALGERRAAAVRDYLVDLGVAADRLSTLSYGEELPVAIGPGESAWSLNRRAELRTWRPPVRSPHGDRAVVLEEGAAGDDLSLEVVVGEVLGADAPLRGAELEAERPVTPRQEDELQPPPLVRR